MTTRRDFLKTTGALAALPLAFLGKKDAASKPPSEAVRLTTIKPEYFDIWPHQRVMTDNALAIDSAASVGMKWYPDAYWRDIGHHQGEDYYYNMIDKQFWISRRGHWCTQFGMLCPSCLMKSRERESKDSDAVDPINRMLSITMNTCPHDFYGTYWYGNALLDNCLCGHPWLKTAHEDFVLWMRGERDDEREARRSYPTISEWIAGIKT